MPSATARVLRRLLPAIACVLVSLRVGPAAAAAEPRTVCTITVNSADEKEAFRRHLPEARYRFVELVERGRPDWLASACRSGVRCDVLVISGHYDGSSVFFSDSLEISEHLPVAELERASCSGSCPGIFSHLQEVYLFGCNTLNPNPQSSGSADVVRSLVREGHARAEAVRLLQEINDGHGDSSRNRMRQIFEGVPVIYGFPSLAPLGPIAATSLQRYLQSNGDREIGRGRASSSLLGHFSAYGLSSAPGLRGGETHADARDEMCRFVDDRLTDAARLAFVHQLLQRPTAEVRMHLDRIHRLMDTLDDGARLAPSTAQVLEDIARDADARTRFMALARDADQPGVRVRMLDVARQLGWLTPEAHQEQLALMLDELLARVRVGVTEVDLACTLNAANELDGAFNRRVVAGGPADDVPHAAVRACLGSDEGRARMLAALHSPDEADVLTAQAYLRHRPITDPRELRRVAADIVGMATSASQVRALEALGRHYVADAEIVDALVRLFASTPSEPVQAAIAGILIRAERKSLDRPRLLETLRDRRLASDGRDGNGIVDALLRRLSAP